LEFDIGPKGPAGREIYCKEAAYEELIEDDRVSGWKTGYYHLPVYSKEIGQSLQLH
jgi:hypothetical protein